ncbi:MAG: hypothetical protein HC803_04530 [Saprospiraceae bacterium]|nr:hypothetical protein [Saprospiraceae bacterium]
MINKRTQKRLTLGVSNVRDMVIMNDSLYYVDPEQFKIADLKGNLSKSILTGAGRMLTKHPNSDTIYIANKNGFFHYIMVKQNKFLKMINRFIQLAVHGKAIPFGSERFLKGFWRITMDNFLIIFLK